MTRTRRLLRQGKHIRLSTIINYPLFAWLAAQSNGGESDEYYTKKRGSSAGAQCAQRSTTTTQQL